MNGSPPGSMGFIKQEYFSGLPFPLPEDLPNPGIQPTSQSRMFCIAGGSLPLSHHVSPAHGDRGELDAGLPW